MTTYSYGERSALSHFLFADRRSAWVWLVVRVYLGWQWLGAGWDKLHNPAWVGETGGTALLGFVNGALQKTGGPHPDVQWWYAAFLEKVVMPNAAVWAQFVALGEFLVGAALILGVLVGISAFFGGFMNMSFLLAGTVSVNPIWLILAILLMLSWRVSGYIGLDRFVLPIARRLVPRF